LFKQFKVIDQFLIIEKLVIGARFKTKKFLRGLIVWPTIVFFKCQDQGNSKKQCTDFFINFSLRQAILINIQKKIRTYCIANSFPLSLKVKTPSFSIQVFIAEILRGMIPEIGCRYFPEFFSYMI